MENFCFFIIALLFSGIITAVMTKKLIPRLTARKAGQTILEIGPSWHKHKEGTPTMGGLSFLVAISGVSLILSFVINAIGGSSGIGKLIITILFAAANSFVGIFDDSVKISKKENKGLSPTEKLLLQSAIAAVYLLAMRVGGYISTSLKIPFTDITAELGFFYYVISFFLILFVVNCANLTDGIDGLAASVCLVIGVFFGYLAFVSSNTALSVISGAICGGCIGFLLYNFFPAGIFMGDTGSLFFGALAVGCAFMANNPLIILVCGFIYALEGISVILQVTVFKITGKRLFKMSPIHHHFEKSGYTEIFIVFLFTLISGFFAFLAALAVRM